MKVKRAAGAVLEFVTGWFAFDGVNFVFDKVIYLPVLWVLGSVWGGLVMTTLSIPFNIVLLRVYDWTKRDALKAAAAREWFFKRWKIKMLLRIPLAVLWLLTFLGYCWKDPVPATVFLCAERSGRRFWTRFIPATVISNIMYIVQWTILFEILKRAWQWYRGL